MIPAYYSASLGKVLRNIISLHEQRLARGSFIPDPASEFKDPGQVREEFARHRGVCSGAEGSDRLWGVFSVYQPFSRDSAEGALKHSHAESAAAGPTGSCRANLESSVHMDSQWFVAAGAKPEPTLGGETKGRHGAVSLCKRPS